VRIVLDTNVIVSALLWRGTPYRLLETLRQHDEVQICSSAALLEELTEVLGRPSAVKRLAVIGKTGRALFADYLEAVELVEPLEVPRVVPGDPDDDHVLAAAVTAQADLIVSGDRKHLLPLGSHQNIPIITADEALQRLTAPASGTPPVRP